MCTTNLMSKIFFIVINSTFKSKSCVFTRILHRAYTTYEEGINFLHNKQLVLKIQCFISVLFLKQHNSKSSSIMEKNPSTSSQNEKFLSPPKRPRPNRLEIPSSLNDSSSHSIINSSHGKVVLLNFMKHFKLRHKSTSNP